MSVLPTCYIEGFSGGGFCGEEAMLCGKELSSRGTFKVQAWPREVAPIPSLSRSDVVVGSPDFVRRGLRQLGVAIPNPPDYPACLRAALLRKIEVRTLGEVAALFAAAPETRIFVKPARDAKAFNGELLDCKDEADMWLGMWTEAHGASYPVLCSEPIDIVVEHRVYCLRGEVVGVGHYGKSAPEGCPAIDMDVVRAAARTLFESPTESLVGCAMDFAIVRTSGGAYATALIEVNDGVFTGFYKGVSERDFTDMNIARWQQIVGVSSPPAPAPGAAAGGAGAVPK